MIEPLLFVAEENRGGRGHLQEIDGGIRMRATMACSYGTWDGSAWRNSGDGDESSSRRRLEIHGGEVNAQRRCSRDLAVQAGAVEASAGQLNRAALSLYMVATASCFRRGNAGDTPEEELGDARHGEVDLSGSGCR